jgi:hypothetical protein
LVVEEEFEHARQRGIPIYVFVQHTDRDRDAERLLSKASDYVTGRFRVQFETPGELTDSVERALADSISRHRTPVTDSTILVARASERTTESEPLTLRFVLAPERGGELIDPVQLGSRDFLYDLYEVGHRRDVELLSFEVEKSTELSADTLVIQQGQERGRWDGPGPVRIEVQTSGLLCIDTALVGRSAAPDRMFSGMMIVRSDVEAALRASFAFTTAWLERIDPYHRQEIVQYIVALRGLSHRRWVEEVTHSNSFSGGFGQRRDPWLPWSDPRRITRPALQAPSNEIARFIALAQREFA